MTDRHPVSATTRGQNTPACAPSDPDWERPKKELRRTLLAAGILLLATGNLIVVVAKGSFETVPIVVTIVFGGLCALWLSRQIRLERRTSILLGVCAIWSCSLVFGSFLGLLIASALRLETFFEKLVYVGLFGGLALMMELGLIGVAWRLTQLWRRLAERVRLKRAATLAG
jgi:hypothetical protein